MAARPLPKGRFGAHFAATTTRVVVMDVPDMFSFLAPTGVPHMGPDLAEHSLEMWDSQS